MKHNYFIIFWHNPTASWCTCLFFAQFLQLSQTATPPNSIADKLTCHSRPQGSCPTLPTVTRVLVAAGTVLFTTCTEKLIFTALWAQGFMCLSSHFQQQVIHNMSFNFNMSSHLAVPVSCLPLTVISLSTFATLCFRTRLCVGDGEDQI
jgi:hypothetical protein